MEISSKEINGIVSVAISGRLDTYSVPEAEKVIETILKEDTHHLLFNFSDLEYVSSGGLRVILTAVKELRQKDGHVVMCCLTDYVKEIFEISGFTSIIPVADSVEAGLEALS